MPKFNAVFGTDKQKSLTGVWDESVPGMRFLIARWDNPNFKKVQKEKRKPHLNKLLTSDITEELGELADKLVHETVAETILLGWEGVDDDDGNPTEYSVEQALKYFEQEKEFYQGVVAFSKDINNYRMEVKEISEKNS